ncbi:DUF2244 domain-containing protein [Cochlodiniinecator piscidefendens]|uniref:DUF2244 domain-containing protein n=1 Tax=Cochlodiniinecator piscidefendens TaxID=2715756 RepID=UPI00140C144B|nr:DUF2244 domain-containing protein [Cochlodiniinecator piscidefendens]
MPYEWQHNFSEASDISGASLYGKPIAKLSMWPYRSLRKKGFVGFIAGTAVMMCLPLLGLVGSFALWILLPFVLLTVGCIWYAIDKSYKQGEVLEELVFFSEEITLVHLTAGQEAKRWNANPYWVDVRLLPNGGPVANYLTLRGNNREVEIGAFLSEEERLILKAEIEHHLRDL